MCWFSYRCCNFKWHENMLERNTPSSIRTTDSRNNLNCVCSRHDTLCHGIETPAQQNPTVSLQLTCKSTLQEAVNKRFGGILSELLNCVASMLGTRTATSMQTNRVYVKCSTQLDEMETDSDSTHRGWGPTDWQLKPHCLTCMMKSWLRMKRLNNITAQQVSERNRFWLCFTGNGDICKWQQNNFCVCGVCVTFI